MSTVGSINPRSREAILRELSALAAGLRTDYPVEAVYVFGSFARGEEHEGSDIDLLIVGELPGRVFDRIGEVLRRTDLPVEPIVLSPQAFAERCRAGHPLFVRIKEEALRVA